MTYTLSEDRGKRQAIEIADLIEAFFKESIYRTLTFDLEKTRQSILSMMMDSDCYNVVARDENNVPVGIAQFAFESPWMAEEVMLCINFFVMPEHRNGKCSQMLMDTTLKICKDRGAKLVWASSTAGFSDNGCNERAFRMFLKRNSFRTIGTFLVWEPADGQVQEGS